MPCPEVTGDTIQDGTQFKSLWRRLIPGTLVGIGHLGGMANDGHGIPMVSMVSMGSLWDGDRIEDPGEPFKMNR